jgi:hypothetical protein
MEVAPAIFANGFGFPARSGKDLGATIPGFPDLLTLESLLA